MTSVLCHVSLRTLGITFITRLAMSALYALLPYTFYRNIAHISLTYMFVPVLATYSIGILADQRFSRSTNALTIFACVAMGFDYIYHAFFACFFLLVAGVFGSVTASDLRPMRRALPFIGLIALCALLNMVPTLLTWYANGGVPASVNVKRAQ